MPNVQAFQTITCKWHILSQIKVTNDPYLNSDKSHPLCKTWMYATPMCHLSYWSKNVPCCLSFLCKFSSTHHLVISVVCWKIIYGCHGLYSSSEWTLSLKGGGEWLRVSNRFMAACEPVSSRTILHVKTGIHTLHLQTVYHVETTPCLCLFQLADSFSHKHWYELNIQKSKRDILGADKRIFTESTIWM